jgi:hypothetical protein
VALAILALVVLRNWRYRLHPLALWLETELEGQRKVYKVKLSTSILSTLLSGKVESEPDVLCEK